MNRALLQTTNHNTTDVVGISKMIWWFKKQVRRNSGLVMKTWMCLKKAFPSWGKGPTVAIKSFSEAGLGQDKGLSDTSQSRDPGC